MVGEERTEDDAAFIAAANPAVVLALIAESSNLFSTNTINCGIGDFVTSSLKIWFS